MENIIKLEKDFVKKHYEGWSKPVHFIQLEETENAYLYKREIGEKYVDYEVFLKKVKNKRKNVNGTIVNIDEKREVYPRASDFGKWAWSFKDINRAYAKLREIQ